MQLVLAENGTEGSELLIEPVMLWLTVSNSSNAARPWRWMRVVWRCQVAVLQSVWYRQEFLQFGAATPCAARNLSAVAARRTIARCSKARAFTVLAHFLSERAALLVKLSRISISRLT